MTEHIKVRPVEGTWVIRAGGAVLGETTTALEVSEGDFPAVIYIPRNDMAMAFLDRTDHTSHCPHKGEARYFSIVTKSQTLKNVAWTYESPPPALAAIKDRLAFQTNMGVTVERV